MTLMRKISQNFFLIFFSLIIIFLVLEVFIRIVLGDSPRKKFDLDTRGQPIPFIEDEILGGHQNRTFVFIHGEKNNIR